MTIPHSLRCPDCKRHLTAAEVIERWCIRCESDVRDEKSKEAA